MRNSDNRPVNQGLFVFLFKLRSGNFNNLVFLIFDIKHEQLVPDFCESVLKLFEKNILPKYLE